MILHKRDGTIHVIKPYTSLIGIHGTSIEINKADMDDVVNWQEFYQWLRNHVYSHLENVEDDKCKVR